MGLPWTSWALHVHRETSYSCSVCFVWENKNLTTTTCASKVGWGGARHLCQLHAQLHRRRHNSSRFLRHRGAPLHQLMRFLRSFLFVFFLLCWLRSFPTLKTTPSEGVNRGCCARWKAMDSNCLHVYSMGGDKECGSSSHTNRVSWL